MLHNETIGLLDFSLKREWIHSRENQLRIIGPEGACEYFVYIKETNGKKCSNIRSKNMENRI